MNKADAQLLEESTATKLAQFMLQLNPGIEEAKILGLERRTLRGENNLALKRDLIARWKEGPFGVVAARRTAARKLERHGKDFLKSVKQQLLPLEYQEWSLRKAEREAQERVELEDAARVEQTLREEQALLEQARLEQARAAHTAKVIADKESNRLAMWMVKKKVAKGATALALPTRSVQSIELQGAPPLLAPCGGGRRLGALQPRTCWYTVLYTCTHPRIHLYACAELN
jgi:hypothetical protein